MKVNELITKLSKLDPESEVLTYHDESYGTTKLVKDYPDVTKMRGTTGDMPDLTHDMHEPKKEKLEHPVVIIEGDIA